MVFKTRVKKIIPTNIKKEHAEVDACVLWCIDPRFRKALWDFERAMKLKSVDIIKVAGGGKALAGNNEEKKNLLGQIAASIHLHKPKKIVPMLHYDCGAYKPLSLKKGQDEKDFLEEEMSKIVLSLTHFGLPIQGVIVDFDKIFCF